MNTIERRALYTLLRINWLNDPSLKVEPWQTEDYRVVPLFDLFERLKQHQIHLDRQTFIAFADESDSPEELTEQLVGDSVVTPSEGDQIYLLVFEIWRRLCTEKPSISIVCNELDHQIYLYDTDEIENPLALQDSLIHFSQILDQNVDEGVAPTEAITLISAYCANDVETFLYDFITQQIEEENESYAQELLDEFEVYLHDNKWFKLLHLRLSNNIHGKTAQKLIQQLIDEKLDENDIEFNLEFLSLIEDAVDDAIFFDLIKKTSPLLRDEEDFQDLLSIAAEYFHRQDRDAEAHLLNEMVRKRKNIPLDHPINKCDPDLAIF